MENNDYNPADLSVPSDLELGSEGGGANESGVDVLKTINDIAGREYKTVDDAKKGIKETFDFVGKAGQSQKLVTEIAGKLGLDGEKGVMQWLNAFGAGSAPAETPETKSQPASKEDVKDLRFLVDHPDLKEHLTLIKKIASVDGVEYDEAVKSDYFQNYLKGVTATRENQPSVLESNQRVGFSSDKARALTESYKLNPSEKSATDLVKEVLGG